MRIFCPRRTGAQSAALTTKGAGMAGYNAPSHGPSPMTPMRSPRGGRTPAVAAVRRAVPALDRRGRLSSAQRIPSPNHDARPADTAITLIVVHAISLPPGRFGGDDIARLFTNRLDPAAHPSYPAIAPLRVSAHFLIRRDGAVIQFVDCAKRAWHAGVSSWRGRLRCNDFSIGIELEGTDTRPYTARQYARLARLVRALRQRYPIADVVGHSDVAPGRKTDPGAAFDWTRLRALLAA
jgi:AmpD protein